MKTAGIIAEYNPFHSGHAYHIRKTRERTGADYIIAVMSGDFVQRGEPACTDKYFRTRMALQGGADLVIELPVSCAAASAEGFAAAGAGLMEALGCVDFLSFGSEWADLDDYQPFLRLLTEEPESYRILLRDSLRQGLSFPAARSRAAGIVLGQEQADAFLKEPNHILGLEYLKALRKMGSAIEPVVIRRQGGGYHESSMDTGFPSATAVRETLFGLAREEKSPEEPGLFRAVGDGAADLLDHVRRGEYVLWDDLMPLLDYEILMNAGEKKVPSEEDGLSRSDLDLRSRIIRTYRAGRSFEDLVLSLHSRNRTDTAVRRCLLHMLLHIRPGQGPVPYARILGFRKRAAPLLKVIREAGRIPLIQKPAEGLSLWAPDERGAKMYQEDIRAAGLYEQTAARKSGRLAVSELSRPQVII